MRLLFVAPLRIVGTQFIGPILFAEASSATDDNLILTLAVVVCMITSREKFLPEISCCIPNGTFMTGNTSTALAYRLHMK